MSRKRCIRKHWAKVNPIELAISGATITSETDLDKLRLRELAAIEQFATGKAQPADFRDLCDMLNLAETMAGMGIGHEVLAACRSAQHALLAANECFERDRCMVLADAGLLALRNLYEFHDLQRTSMDRSTYERAIAKTRNRIHSAHPAVKVLA